MNKLKMGERGKVRYSTGAVQNERESVCGGWKVKK